MLEVHDWCLKNGQRVYCQKWGTIKEINVFKTNTKFTVKFDDGTEKKGLVYKKIYTEFEIDLYNMMALLENNGKKIISFPRDTLVTGSHPPLLQEAHQNEFLKILTHFLPHRRTLTSMFKNYGLLQLNLVVCQMIHRVLMKRRKMRVMRYRRRHRPSHRGIRTKKWRIRLPR
jgi:hypothetical protein